MKNLYEIRGDFTAIFLRRRDGTVIETLIDTEDLSKVQEIEGWWCAYWDPKMEGFYVVGKHKKDGKSWVNIPLHRLVTNAQKGYVVDHFDRNGLDNRKRNIRVVTHAENMQNKIAYRNSKTGIRGVSWDSKSSKWKAQAQLYGKKIHIGLYNSIEDAESAVIEYRSRNMPYSQEAATEPA